MSIADSKLAFSGDLKCANITTRTLKLLPEDSIVLPLDKYSPNPAQSPLRAGVLRDFAMRQERLARDQRVDLPEIQESFRVSFSDAALAASAENARSVLQKNRPTDEGGATELKLRAYRAIAAL